MIYAFVSFDHESKEICMCRCVEQYQYLIYAYFFSGKALWNIGTTCPSRKLKSKFLIRTVINEKAKD
jgi:hypothetical protein